MSQHTNVRSMSNRGMSMGDTTQDTGTKVFLSKDALFRRYTNTMAQSVRIHERLGKMTPGSDEYKNLSTERRGLETTLTALQTIIDQQEWAEDLANFTGYHLAHVHNVGRRDPVTLTAMTKSTMDHLRKSYLKDPVKWQNKAQQERTEMAVQPLHGSPVEMHSAIQGGVQVPAGSPTMSGMAQDMSALVNASPQRYNLEPPGLARDFQEGANIALAYAAAGVGTWILNKVRSGHSFTSPVRNPHYGHYQAHHYGTTK